MFLNEFAPPEIKQGPLSVLKASIERDIEKRKRLTKTIFAKRSLYEKMAKTIGKNEFRELQTQLESMADL